MGFIARRCGGAVIAQIDIDRSIAPRQFVPILLWAESRDVNSPSAPLGQEDMQDLYELLSGLAYDTLGQDTAAAWRVRQSTLLCGMKGTVIAQDLYWHDCTCAFWRPGKNLPQ